MNVELETKPKRRRFRFSIGTLLFLILCVGVLLGGFCAGYLWGFARGTRQQEAERPVPKVYAIADLVLPPNVDPANNVADYDSLIETITTTIEPTSWDTVGGPGAICPYENPMVLIVTQTPPIHDRIVDLLKQLRQHPAPPKKAPISKLSPSPPPRGRGPG